MTHRLSSLTSLAAAISCAIIAAQAPLAREAKLAMLLLGAVASGTSSTLSQKASQDDRVARASRELVVEELSLAKALAVFNRLEPQYQAAGLTLQPLKNSRKLTNNPDAIDLVPIIPSDVSRSMVGYDGHLLIASRTRSGKTTLVQAAIAQLLRTKPNCTIAIFDPKGADWLGLQQSEGYHLCNRKEYVEASIEALNALEAMMERRQSQRIAMGGHYPQGREPDPVHVIIDEFNSLQLIAGQHHKDSRQRLTQLVNRFICQGAEDKVHIWLMAQTTRVQQLGLDTSLQQNMGYLALSRLGDVQSVRDAIRNPYVVTDSVQRKRLNATIDDYEQDDNQDKKIPIAFSTIGGIGLLRLPDYSNVTGRRLNPRPKPGVRTIDTHSPQSSLSPSQADQLLKYLTKKAPVDVRTIAQNWGKDRGLNTEAVKALLQELVRSEKVGLDRSKANWSVSLTIHTEKVDD